MRGQLAASISRKYTENEAMVGTNLVYAAIHQFVGRAGRGGKAEIPARPYLKLTEEDLNEIKKAVIDYLVIKMPMTDDGGFILPTEAYELKVLRYFYEHGYRPQCVYCRYFDFDGWFDNDLRRCKAFDEIPDEIWQNKYDHKKPYPGDKGFTYKD